MRARTQEQADELSAILCPPGCPPDQLIKIGERVKREPCMSREELANPKAKWQRAGRPCPRVKLPPSMATAGHLAMLINTESPLIGPYLAMFPRSRRKLLYARASHGLSSPRVLAFIKAARDAERQAADAHVEATQRRRAGQEEA